MTLLFSNSIVLYDLLHIHFQKHIKYFSDTHPCRVHTERTTINTLFRIQLDDEVLLDVIVKVFLNRHTQNLSCLVVLVYLKPCRSCL